MGEGPGLVERSGEGGVDAEGEVIVGLTPTKIKGVDTFTQMWALVETDADVTSAIKDVRTRLGEYHEKGHKNQPHLADLEGEGTHVHAHTHIYTTYIEVVGRTYMCACTLHDMYLADLVGAGTLYVQLLCAKGLLSADANGLSDPYCIITLGEHKQRSRKLKRTLDPVWENEIFAFAGVLGHLIESPLQMTMMDFDLRAKDDLLGHVPTRASHACACACAPMPTHTHTHARRPPCPPMHAHPCLHTHTHTQAQVDIELADHKYCNDVRRDIGARLDTQGTVNIQV